MARKNQHTFAKRQREQKKAEKAAEKLARRESRRDGEERPPVPDADVLGGAAAPDQPAADQPRADGDAGDETRTPLELPVVPPV